MLYADLFKMFIVTAQICSRISVGLQASFFLATPAGPGEAASPPPPSGCWDHPVDWDSRETPRASAAPQDQPARPPSSPPFLPPPPVSREAIPGIVSPLVRLLSREREIGRKRDGGGVFLATEDQGGGRGFLAPSCSLLRTPEG